MKAQLALPVICLIVGACVSGPPDLTVAQQQKAASLPLYPPGVTPSRAYSVLQTITAADCSGAPLGGRVWGNAERAIEALKSKAVAANADAVIDVKCAAAPLLNNCWAAQKCTGQAVAFTDHSTAAQ